jgi:hypothetical protein
MSDLELTFGSDLQLSPNGDLALVTGPMLTEQRVLRRLLTNKGDYIWQLGYGAGLAQFIGQPGVPEVISGLVRTQLSQESQIAAVPAPQTIITADQGGNLVMVLQYTDTTTNQTNAIQVPM